MLRALWRDFGTTYEQLVACRTWLPAPGGPLVVLESTGVDWTPLAQALGDPLAA